MFENQRIDTNFWVETTKDSCFDSSPRNLAEVLESIITKPQRSNGVMLRRVREGTYKVDISMLLPSECEQIEYLFILRNTNPRHNQLFDESGITQGAYLNKAGNFLILIGLWEARVPFLLNGLFPNLTTIRFHGLKITHLSLTQLTKIETIKLSACYSLRSIDGFNSLSSLTSLSISECHGLASLPEINALTHLSLLRIESCDNLTSICDLRNLAYLENLSITFCNKLDTPLRFVGLVNLRNINISWCQSVNELHLIQCAKLVTLTGLHTLLALRVLDIRKCPYIPSSLEDIKELTQLRTLRLSIARKMRTLPELDNLSQLETLDLSGCNKLVRIPKLANLTQLRYLNLSDCKPLNTLPNMDGLSHLEILNISNTSITRLPNDLQNLPLRKLSIERLYLEELPLWLTDIAERFTSERSLEVGKTKALVCLNRTYIDGVDMTMFNQPTEMIMDWFKNRRSGTVRKLNEIKVVFLGDGEAGKSHTIARLMNDGGEPDYAVFDGQSTPGIVIRNKEYDLGDRRITVHYWDFGGQEIMHSMHRIFLTGRTMYVILLNARDDTQSDRAKYWLHNVKSFAPDAPVLLVLNKIDQNPNASVDEKDLRSRYDKLTQIVRLSAKDFSREEFNEQFKDVLLEEIQKTGFLDAQWPDSWTAVKKKLETMTSHYIMGDAYEDICQECQVNENQENLLHWFNDLGVSFCCRDSGDYALKDYVILRPDWITNALYIILFNTLAGARNGLIPHSSIFDILSTAHKNPAIRCTLPKARYNSGDIQYVLGIMRKFNLSLPDGDHHEFIPMLCQQNSKVDIQYYHKDADTLEFNMHFDYLPNNLLHRLMVERHTELDMENVWRTGARFQFKELGYSAVVVIDGNILRFFIRHTDPMHRPNTYLTMLKAHVDRIVEKMGLKPPICQLIYKLDRKREEFDFGLLNEMLDAGVTGIYSRIQRKQVPIADILNQSAPDVLEDERKLLDAILRSCRNIQGEKSYYCSDEDTRNRRIRDDLYGWGYNIQDQSQRGRSGSGKSIGELDLLLHNDKRNPWTVIEALRVSGVTKATWEEHLDRLIGNYNYFGARFLYLLTYVDTTDDFGRIWAGFDAHIREYAPGGFTCRAESTAEWSDASSGEHIKTVKCQYSKAGAAVTVYHIFARIPTQNE